MAITNNGAKFLFYAKQAGVSFENTLTLGRLNLHASRQNIQTFMKHFSNNGVSLDEIKFPDEYAEPLLKILGANSIQSIDFSDYEKATIIHDMNSPIPGHLKNSFTAVIDTGTMEHVFNFPVAIKNCMEALTINGYYVAITPVNNQMGHGFYQFSPELFYRIFSKENGFEVVKMLITAHPDETNIYKWYEVADPKTMKKRVMLVNNFPTSLMFIAKKTHEAPIFNRTPQQSDYASTWQDSDVIKSGGKPEGISTTRHLYRRLVPRKVKIFVRNIYDLFTREKQEVGDLGMVNPNQFKEIKL
jgi:hypothetical protein